MPDKRPSVKNEKQYEALKEKGMSKQRAARIANSPGASSRGGKSSRSRSSSSKQGGTTAQKKAAGRKGGKAAARKASQSIWMSVPNTHAESVLGHRWVVGIPA